MTTIRRHGPRLLVFLFLTVGIAVVGFLIAQREMLAQGHVSFTAVATNSVYKRSGNAVLVEKLVLATRRDGSTVRVRSVAAPAGFGGAPQRRVLDLSRGEELQIDGLTESLTTYPLRRATTEYLRKKPSSCTNDSSALRGTMLGFEVVRVVEDSGDARMPVRSEEWRAPALDCFPLRSTIWRGKGADMYTSSITEVSQVTVGDPATSLFERPAGYVERSPSERRQEYYKRYPERAARLCQSCLQKSDQHNDEVYTLRQRNRGR